MNECILLIDDNETNIELMSYLLEAFGYRVQTGHSGAEGLEMARQQVPDLIICDVLMPGMDGYEVARRLGADPQLAAVPLVAVTALAMVDDREKILGCGFDDYIAKPIDSETFVDEIAALLKRLRVGSKVPPA
jgi:two-component system cell cycle response regulator